MSLKNKLKNLQKEGTTSNIDWKSRKEEWKKAVDDLFATIKGWFADYVKNKDMALRESKRTLREEYIGDYEVPELTYEMGPYNLMFQPAGRNIIGGKGRVDMYIRGYKSGKYMLVLLEDDNGRDQWIIVPSIDKTKRIPLNKTELEKLVESMIDRSSI